MTDNELSAIIDSASMIVDGYAFSQIGEDNIRCVGINKPHHAAIMRQDGEVLETNMDDVELDIVGEYWQRNKKYMEEELYAEIL